MKLSSDNPLCVAESQIAPLTGQAWTTVDSAAVPEPELIYVYDIEVFPNFFLAMFKEISDGKPQSVRAFTWEQREELETFLRQAHLTLVGYNNFRFDDAILNAILGGKVSSTALIHKLADDLIHEPDASSQSNFELRYYGSPWTCIDLLQILGGPQLAGSLKSHEVRLRMLNVQELPIPPGTVLTPEQQTEITNYCENDVNATEALYRDLLPAIEVRHNVNFQYSYLKGSALRRSNASIAETVMVEELRIKAAFDKSKWRRAESFAFNPKTRIDPTIHFSGAKNRSALEALRALPTFEAGHWQKLYAPQFTFEIGSHVIALNQGGLHTDPGSMCVRSDALIEYDVSSYYPNLLRKFGRVPVGLPDQWLQILNDLTAKRITAKTGGDKATADVYKIIINSLYGKLGDRFSINFDPGLQLEVVINGQLFLLMLMERLHDMGIRVIAANTDGILIDAGREIDSANAVADKWMIDTGFSLERKRATMYAASSINDYALFHPETGWFQRKGRYSVNAKTLPPIISAAVLESVSSGASVETHITAAKNIFDFLISGSVKGNAVEVRHAQDKVQKTNRWYKSVCGHPIERISKKTDGSVKIAKVANSDAGRVVNHLSDTTIPTDLDRAYYIRQATDLLNAISNPEPQKVQALPSLIVKAKRAQHLGLTIVPKGNGKHGKADISEAHNPQTISYWTSTPLEQADWQRSHGFGAYTGAPFGIVAIDIDDPVKAAKAGLFSVLPKTGGLIAWHGANSARDVREGRCGGTIIFRYAGSSVATTTGRFLRNYGFEILYGNKVVQLAGIHPSQEAYRYAGRVGPIPQLLLNQLEWMMPDEGGVNGIESEGSSPAGIIDGLTQFQTIANNDEQYATAGGHLDFSATKAQKHHLKGLCVGHHAHRDKSNTQEMMISWWQGAPKVSCFHHSCGEIRGAWEKTILDQIVSLRSVKIKPKNIHVVEQFQDVMLAVQHPARNKLIIAPTGSGKTFNIVAHIAALLDSDSGNTDKFAIICSSKDQMRQIADRFAAVLESDNINEHGIDLIEAQGAMQIGKARSRASVRDGTRVAITHYIYVSRRKFSMFYYAFLKFIDENTHVFIDEVDAFIDSQTARHQLGSRWKKTTGGGISKSIHVHKCGMFHHFNNCLNCVMRKYDGFQMSVDQYGAPVYLPVNEIVEGVRQQELGHVELENRVLSKVKIGTNEVWMLKQEEHPGELTFDDLETKADFNRIFEDWLKSAYLPTVHRPFISYKGDEIGREELIRDHASIYGTKLNIQTDDPRDIQFPSRACNVLTVTLIDRRPLLWMAKAKSLTGLSATLTPLQRRFFSDIVVDLKEITIQPLNERRMDKILVVGTAQDITVNTLAGGEWKFGKLFRFRPTLSAAERDFNALKGTNIVTKLGYSNKQYMGSSEDVTDHHLLLAYSFGSLGRGIDFAHYDIVDVNAGIYKPISAYVTDDPAVVRQQINQDRASTLRQNIGRILRRRQGDEAIKIVVLEELESEDEFAEIVTEMAKMSIQPVQSWWVPSFISTEEMCEWLTKICESKTLPADLPTDPFELIGRARKLIDAGANKMVVKAELRWKTIRKALHSQTLHAIEVQIDNMFLLRRDDVSTQKPMTPEKQQKVRTRRLEKIRALMATGKSDGQIRNNMKVVDKKQGWPEDERVWFEQALLDERQIAVDIQLAA